MQSKNKKSKSCTRGWHEDCNLVWCKCQCHLKGQTNLKNIKDDPIKEHPCSLCGEIVSNPIQAWNHIKEKHPDQIPELDV